MQLCPRVLLNRLRCDAEGFALDSIESKRQPVKVTGHTFGHSALQRKPNFRSEELADITEEELGRARV